MQPLTVILSPPSPRLGGVLEAALSAAGAPAEVFPAAGPYPGLAGRRVLFALSVGENGMDADAAALLLHLRSHPDAMEGCVAAMLIDGAGELYTKQLSHMLAFAANRAGCTFPGKPLVEATGSLKNWAVQAGRRGVSEEEAYRQSAVELVKRLMAFSAPRASHPSLLMLHASDRATSNTLSIGRGLLSRLEPHLSATELSLQNGTVEDCRGCSYKACRHFARQNSCFYGGSIVSEVYPAILKADALLLLCPNYNDSVSANIMACINRLTSLLVYNTLYQKYLYAVVVSGYSGGDLVAQQVLGALCLNKTFMLPPRFALLETANDPGDALRAPGIEGRMDAFAASMLQTMAGGPRPARLNCEKL